MFPAGNLWNMGLSAITSRFIEDLSTGNVWRQAIKARKRGPRSPPNATGGTKRGTMDGREDGSACWTLCGGLKVLVQAFQVTCVALQCVGAETGVSCMIRNIVILINWCRRCLPQMQLGREKREGAGPSKWTSPCPIVCRPAGSCGKRLSGSIGPAHGIERFGAAVAWLLRGWRRWLENRGWCWGVRAKRRGSILCTYSPFAIHNSFY